MRENIEKKDAIKIHQQNNSNATSHLKDNRTTPISTFQDKRNSNEQKIDLVKLMQGKGLNSKHIDRQYSGVLSSGLDNQVVQGKFSGKLGGDLSTLTPSYLKVEDTYYNNLWTSLNSLPVDILVENGVPCCYIPATKTLNLNEYMVQSLVNHQKEPLAPDVLADHVALITHELSHAHDSLIMERELKGDKGSKGSAKVTNVLKTEALAWEREARTGQRLLPADHTGQSPTTPLWAGWMKLEPEMIDSYEHLESNKGRNEVVNRYYRYFKREISDLNGDVNGVQTQEWFKTYGEEMTVYFIYIATLLRNAIDTVKGATDEDGRK